MVSVLVVSVVDSVFDPRRVQPKTIQLVFAASPLKKQYEGVTAK